MCGIFGAVDLVGKRDFSPRALAAMGDAIAHRGPDDDGTFRDAGIALGSRRLALVDPVGGKQPVSEERWIGVVNGELFDHAAERGLQTAERAGTSRGPYSPSFNRSRALLIGIGEAYRKHAFPPLANAVSDVQALDGALKSLAHDRWETQLLLDEDATQERIQNALAELDAELDLEDRVLVYFAGHGVPRAGSNVTRPDIVAPGCRRSATPSTSSPFTSTSDVAHSAAAGSGVCPGEAGRETRADIT